MLAIRNIFFIVLISLSLFGCSDNKNKPIKTENQDSNSENQQSNLPDLIYNTIDLSDLNLNIEVIYQINDTEGVYKEWVHQKLNDESKYSYFEFKFSKDNYLSFKSNPTNYYDTFTAEKKAVQLSESQIDELKSRFSNSIDAEDFQDVKQDYENQLNQTVDIASFTKSCSVEWEAKKKNILNFFNTRFQHCHHSKYNTLAKADVKSFISQNRYLSYRKLFGLDLVLPQISSFLEINTDGDSFLGLGTAYSPDSYFYKNDRNRNLTGDCDGVFIDKKVSDYKDNKNLFFDAQKEPEFLNALYFVNACTQLYAKSKSLIDNEIKNLYPEASDFFNYTVSSSVSRTFYIEPIDRKISEELDKQIEKYNFLLPGYNNSSLVEIYQGWKKIEDENEKLRFSGAFLYLGPDTSETDYNYLKLEILNPQSRLRFLGDESIAKIPDDEQALADLERYILLIDVLEE